MDETTVTVILLEVFPGGGGEEAATDRLCVELAVRDADSASELLEVHDGETEGVVGDERVDTELL